MAKIGEFIKEVYVEPLEMPEGIEAPPNAVPVSPLEQPTESPEVPA